MKFVKSHSYEIFKLLINQVGMAIFGLVLSLASNNFGSMLLFVSLFSVGFYMVLIYTMLWDIGSKDGIRCRARKMKGDILIGLKVSLCANIINIVIAILMVIGCVIASGRGGDTPGLYNFALGVGGVIEAMYLGIIKYVVDGASFAPDYAVSTVMYCIIIIPSIVCATLGYVFGYTDRRLFGRLFAKSSDR